MVAVIVVALNTIIYQYSPKKKKKNVPGARDNSRLEPHPFPLPFLQPIGPSSTRLCRIRLPRHHGGDVAAVGWSSVVMWQPLGGGKQST